MIGWFPRYSPDGLRLTWERPGYWQSQWLDNETEIAHDGERLLIGGQRTEHPAPNELSAGGGRWAAWRAGVGVVTSWGETLPAAGCPTIAPDGEFYYVDDRQGDTKALIHGGFRVASGAIVDVRCSRTALVFTLNGRTWGRRHDVPGDARDIQIAPTEFRPIPIDTPRGPWVLNHTHTGIVLRPFGETHGYRFDNGGQTFNPDGTWRDGVIRVAFSDERGNISELSFDPSAPRVDLRAPAAPSPPDPQPEPTPDPEPLPMAEPLPASAVASVARYVARFPVPQMAGPGPSDEAFENVCRSWILGLAEQVQFDTGDARFGVKRSAGPQSKDAIAFNGPRLIGYDMLGGVGTGHPVLNPNPAGEDITGQTFIPVKAVNHLGAQPPSQPQEPKPQPVPSVDLSAVLDRLDLMEKRALAAQADTVASILRLAESIEKFKMPAPAQVVFPEYESQRLSLFGTITMRPKV